MGHLFEIALTIATALLTHTTWRTLPEEQRHHFRKAARVVRKHSKIVILFVATIGTGLAIWHRHEGAELERE